MLGRHPVAFREQDNIEFRGRERLPGHPNAMRISALDATGTELCSRTYFSVGGGFVAQDGEPAQLDRPQSVPQPYPFASAADFSITAGARGCQSAR